MNRIKKLTRFQKLMVSKCSEIQIDNDNDRIFGLGLVKNTLPNYNKSRDITEFKDDGTMVDVVEFITAFVIEEEVIEDNVSFIGYYKNCPIFDSVNETTYE